MVEITQQEVEENEGSQQSLMFITLGFAWTIIGLSNVSMNLGPGLATLGSFVAAVLFLIAGFLRRRNMEISIKILE